jgi:hypothetical protein
MELGECTIERPAGVEINFHIQPRGSRTEIVGVFGNALKIRIAAPPVNGQANAELIRFLSRQLGVPQQYVQVLSGVSSRHKRVFIKERTLLEIEPFLVPNIDRKKL